MLLERLRALLRRLRGGGASADPLSALASVEQARLRVIVGLGNPGEKYALTRHNVGFRCVDLLAVRLGATWADDTAHSRALVAVAQCGEHTLVLAKPQTFMNDSGAAVRVLCDLVGAAGQVLVVFDEMDLPFGTLRLRARGSAGTHNGMRSIVRELGTDRFPRLRIGIGQAGQRDAIDHVLGMFAPAEESELGPLLARAADAAQVWAAAGADAAMNRYNR